MQGIEIAKRGLSSSLLVRHPETGKIYVNFDPAVNKLFSETRHIATLQLEVPPAAAKLVRIDEAKIKFQASWYTTISFVFFERRNSYIFLYLVFKIS